MRRAAAFGIVSINLLANAATAQQQPPAQPQQPGEPRGRRDAPQAPPRPVGSRSLFKSALAAQGDPRQAKVSDVSFYAVAPAEPKTLKKHDQLTIIIREESRFSSDGSAESKKSADFEARLDEFIQLKLRNWEVQGGALGNANPSIKASGARNFKGEGNTERSDKFTARIQAEVVDVKPNGTLVVQARKRIKTDDEVQFFTLSGTCRVEDVAADNTILSTQLFDLDLEKRNTGSVRDATRRGWFPKLLDVLNPF